MLNRDAFGASEGWVHPGRPHPAAYSSEGGQRRAGRARAPEPTSDTMFADVPRLRTGGIEVFTEPASPLIREISIGVAWVERPSSYAVDNGAVIDEAASGHRSSVLLGLRVAVPGFPLLGL